MKRRHFLKLIFSLIPVAGIIFFCFALQALQIKNYMGAGQCGHCHEKQYEIWKKGPHAGAFKSLPASKRENINCLWCHATDARDNFSSYKLKGVQCESCHGVESEAGFSFKSSGFIEKHKRTLKVQNKKICIDCHSEERTPSIEPFKYEEKLKLIKHWD
jgi:hypothetical protein